MIGRDSGTHSHLVYRIFSCGIASEISPSLLWLLWKLQVHVA